MLLFLFPCIFILHSKSYFQASVPQNAQYPTNIGNFRVTAVRDLTTGFDSAQADKRAVLPTSKSSHMITFNLASNENADNQAVLTLRTSGTEPKIKYYSEMSGPWASRSAIRPLLADLTTAVRENLLKLE